MSNIVKTDVLIIGAGLAGLSTALSLPKSLNITILSKAALDVCSSHYAQGGIAASLDKTDSVTDHVSDTLIAGAGLCDAANTADILSAGQQAVQWLCEQGVPFTQMAHSPNDTQPHALPVAATALSTSELHLTKEGGHGCRRVAHADDATGRHVMEALTVKVQAAANITILPYHEALSLLTRPNIGAIGESDINNSDNTDHKKCYGATVFDHDNQRQFTVYSRAVVLASGGLGQLFKRASAPNVCVGDGVMMAWQAGCRLANLEFVQFHPTGLALDDSSFLISEALRGEGGRLYCPQTGKRFMLEVDARAELAPRDIVARAIAEQISKNGMGYVHLDVSHLSADFLQQHFPQIYQTLLPLGIDITTDPIPVAPTAHYSCGGVVASTDGLTDVQGLYAAGEVAYTGLHGANRLASNSLLECVVVGRNIASHLPHYLDKIVKLDNAPYDAFEQPTTDLWSSPVLIDTQPIVLPLTIASTHLHDTANRALHSDTDITAIINALKSLMTANMGITRSAQQLEQALTQIQQWQAQLADMERYPLDMSDDNISDENELGNIQLVNYPLANTTLDQNQLAQHQLSKQLQLATLIVQSAYQRLESRGGHYRLDYPNLDEVALTSIIAPPKRYPLASISHTMSTKTDSIPVMDNV
ncbi:L-aspartate oxidase [Psychrobacter sp. NG254]|uniref:L-aspartate oxidase n=1 Tax=Psychrobacter sp. NG254 TaxID=2782003 RepID=UPI001888D131|nr:L-aspartate oxidase [Psychrobacter sp. NG254]MBF2718311.1 L-aspartate oxidase [Psychrobacter sp. NG254]